MFTNWQWNWICWGKTMLSLTPLEPPFRFSLSNLMQWFSNPRVGLPWDVQTTWWETEGDKNKKARWLLSAPLVPFLFLSSSFSTNEGLSSLQPHHVGCAHGATYSCIGQQDLPGTRGWRPVARGVWADAGEAVALLRRFLLRDGAQDLRKMVQPKERTPDLPPKR